MELAQFRNALHKQSYFSDKMTSWSKLWIWGGDKSSVRLISNTLLLLCWTKFKRLKSSTQAHSRGYLLKTCTMGMCNALLKMPSLSLFQTKRWKSSLLYFNLEPVFNTLFQTAQDRTSWEMNNNKILFLLKTLYSICSGKNRITY